MRKLYGAFAIIASLSLVLSGCTARTGEAPSASAVSVSIQEPESSKSESSEAEPAPNETSEPQKPEQNYIDIVVQETVAKIIEPGMSEYEKAKAAFDYMIANTSLTDPVGLDLWRVRGGHDGLPSFVENRSLSVLLYGIGMCEDYAAAFTMLLRGMGLEAEYVPGLTYSALGTGLVDHSWTIAKIDGVWYHLDPQLEDNISRHDTIRYKYFMRSDATMAGSHRWGQNLIDSRLLTAEQNTEIAENFLFEACPQDYPTPAPSTFTPAQEPDTAVLKAEIEAEMIAYEEENGPLEPLELDIIPPVFGPMGFGPPE